MPINSNVSANIMKAKFGAIVVDGRGKIGGHVMTKNRQGAAMRTKVTPIHRSSNDQQEAKSRFSVLSTSWRSLTPAERGSWDSAAPDYKKSNIFGDSYSPTGKNLFMIVNQGLMLAGEAAVNTPPENIPADALTALSVASNTTAAQTLTFAPTPVPADHVLVIEATRPLSAGVASPGKTFRSIQNIAAAAATPANTFAAYSAKFGTPTTGKKIFFRAFLINLTSGNRSLPLQTSSITA